MDQIALDFDRSNPTDLLTRLDLAASPAGITRITVRRGRGKRAAPEGGRIGHILQQAREELAEYFAGDRTFFTVPVDLSRVPAFERAALQIASQIPYGEVRSYKWIAEQLGTRDAARAVGGAMAANPVPLIVPCHRVVKTDGGLGGYSFGLIQKEALLNLERSTAPYVGCASTRIFCRKGCTHERRIREGGRIHFASGADATASGYRACQVCQPA
jgi:methylated-DNA-[protein]-cysteine S-methyltransferase